MTPRRRFQLADAPGHVQYTRNMVTGASTADVAVVLIDARRGVLEQSKRHAFISALLGIPEMVVAINKMDLVDYSQARFEELVEEFEGFAAKLNGQRLRKPHIGSLGQPMNLVEQVPAMRFKERHEADRAILQLLLREIQQPSDKIQKTSQIISALFAMLSAQLTMTPPCSQ